MGRELDDQTLHAGHHSIRLNKYDYSAPGFCFVTICAHGKKCVLGTFHEGRIGLSELGKIVRDCWADIPRHFPRVKLHGFVIMPNHLHGIVEIVAVGAQHAAPLLGKTSDIGVRPHVKAGSLGAIVRSFKAAVTRLARGEFGGNGDIWQRNYFERVLRDGQEISDAGRYIAENPRMWELDRENPQKKDYRLEKNTSAEDGLQTYLRR
jgi:putative transposase